LAQTVSAGARRIRPAGGMAACAVPARPLRIPHEHASPRHARPAYLAAGCHAGAGKRLNRCPMPAQTLAQKLLAAASGRAAVRVGEILTCKVDLAMFHDSSGPRRLKPMLEELGTGLWDRSKVVLVMDHYVPEADDESRRIVRIARDWAREQALPHVYDSMGIC